MHIYIIAWLLIGFFSAVILYVLRWNDGADIDLIDAGIFIPLVVIGLITTIILIHDETDFFKNKVIFKGRKKDD
jgi:hypothetical protein